MLTSSLIMIIMEKRSELRLLAVYFPRVISVSTPHGRPGVWGADHTSSRGLRRFPLGED
jgi:hypothetical protein